MVSDSKSLSGHKRPHSRNRCGKGKQKSNRASDAEFMSSPFRIPSARVWRSSPKPSGAQTLRRIAASRSRRFAAPAPFGHITGIRPFSPFSLPSCNDPLSLQGNANVMHLLDQAETGCWGSNFTWFRLSCAPMGCPPGPFAGWAGT